MVVGVATILPFYFAKYLEKALKIGEGAEKQVCGLRLVTRLA